MSIAHLADTGLPFNRKERFFTGTVLPMLVCADDFTHFGRLTELVRLGRIDVDARPSSANVQFFTEYSFAESVIGEAKARFPGAPTRKDTPDVMIYIAGPPRALIAIEAKMYDRPTKTELNEQLSAQAALVRYIAERLDVQAASLAHVALQLVSPRSTWGANAEMKLTGAEIYDRHHSGSLTAPWMGRQSGLNGTELAKDITSGAWRGQCYECSSKPVQNQNWFTVAEFVARIDAPPLPGSARSDITFRSS
jgi:hypothetical protein